MWLKQSLSLVCAVCKEDRQSAVEYMKHQVSHGQKGSRATLTDHSEVRERHEGGREREEDQVLKNRVSLLRCFSNTLAHEWCISTGFGWIAALFFFFYMHLHSWRMPLSHFTDPVSSSSKLLVENTFVVVVVLSNLEFDMIQNCGLNSNWRHKDPKYICRSRHIAQQHANWNSLNINWDRMGVFASDIESKV